jgi:hypothetical protein
MDKAKRCGQKLFTFLLLQLKKPFVQRLLLSLLSALVAISIGWTVGRIWDATYLVIQNSQTGRMEETWLM